MKALAIFIIFLFLVPSIYAKSKTVILNKGDSYIIEDINVTMMDYKKKEDKIFVCVDNERSIVKDEKRVGLVYIEIKSFRADGVKLTLDAKCEDCVVGDNSKCFPIKPIAENSEGKNESWEEDVLNETNVNKDQVDVGGAKIKEEVKSSYNGLLKRMILAVTGLFS